MCIHFIIRFSFDGSILLMYSICEQSYCKNFYSKHFIFIDFFWALLGRVCVCLYFHRFNGTMISSHSFHFYPLKCTVLLQYCCAVCLLYIKSKSSTERKQTKEQMKNEIPVMTIKKHRIYNTSYSGRTIIRKL